MSVATRIVQNAMRQVGDLDPGMDLMHEARVEDLLRTAELSEEDQAEIYCDAGLKQSQVIKTNRNRIEKPKRTKKQLIDLFSVAEVLAAEGLNPALEIAKALKSDALDLDTKVKLHATLLEYVAPKLKSVEMSGTVKIERTQEEIEARLKELAMMAAPTQGAMGGTEIDVTDPGTGAETSA